MGFRIGGSIGPVSYSKAIRLGNNSSTPPTTTSSKSNDSAIDDLEHVIAIGYLAVFAGSLFTRKGRRKAAEAVNRAITTIAVIVCVAVFGFIGGVVFLAAIAVGGTLTAALGLAGGVVLVLLIFVSISTFMDDLQKRRRAPTHRPRK